MYIIVTNLFRILYSTCYQNWPSFIEAKTTKTFQLTFFVWRRYWNSRKHDCYISHSSV